MPDQNPEDTFPRAAGANRPTIAVLICTYQRPSELDRCLDGLARQTRQPDEIIVVVRNSDQATWTWLDGRRGKPLPVRAVPVLVPGLVAARNAGLEACHTDLQAFIDDDVVPHREWLRRVCEHFDADPELGGCGGRDHVYDGERFDERLEKTVGRIQWFGRTIGNHHLGYGQARPVMVLKGANMTYRRQAISGLRFDERLRGKSTQPHDDMAFSLAVRRNGWKLVYDPAALVYHYAGRPEQRAYSSVSAVVPGDVADTAFNLVIALWGEISPPGKLAFMVWSVLVGTRMDPGLLQALRYTPSQGIAAWRRFRLTQQGKLAAFRSLARTQSRPRAAQSSRFDLSRSSAAPADRL